MPVDYMKALGFLKDEERAKLQELAMGVTMLGDHAGTIVNIGVEYGASIACLRAGSSHCHIIGVDINMATLMPGVAAECKPVLVSGDSCDMVVQHTVSKLIDSYNSNLQLLFIDGDHTYDGVKCDAGFYCKLVAVGGVVIFHDYYAWDGSGNPGSDAWVCGVNVAVDEWFASVDGSWVEIIPHVGTMRMFRRSYVQ